MAEFAKAATAAEVPPGQAKLVEAGGKRIVLFNVGGAYYAIDDTCPHRGGPLSEGPVEGETVTCPATEKLSRPGEASFTSKPSFRMAIVMIWSAMLLPVSLLNATRSELAQGSMKVRGFT